MNVITECGMNWFSWNMLIKIMNKDPRVLIFELPLICLCFCIRNKWTFPGTYSICQIKDVAHDLKEDPLGMTPRKSRKLHLGFILWTPCNAAPVHIRPVNKH